MMRQLVTTATMIALSACTAGAQDEGMVLIEGGTFQMGSPVTELELKTYLPNLANYDVILLGYFNWLAYIASLLLVYSFCFHNLDIRE